jgi:hypothetical protein
MSYNFEELKKRYESLPDDIRQAISSTDVASKLQAIAENYKLMLDKADELAEETSFVMLGITHPDNYFNAVKNRIGTDDETTKKIVNDVNEQIFVQVRESLKKLHSETQNGSKQANNLSDIPDRDEVLAAIENPSNLPLIQQKTSFIDQKLTNVVSAPQEVKTVMPPPPPQYKVDPYREPIA